MPRKKPFKYDCEHYPRNPQEMLGIMASTFGRSVDDPELQLACRWASKDLRETGQVVFFPRSPSGEGLARDPLIFRTAKRGSKMWLSQRTPDERQAWYDQCREWSKRKKKRKEARVGWKIIKR